MAARYQSRGLATRHLNDPGLPYEQFQLDRRTDVLLSSTTPTKPIELLFKEIVEIMERHLTPKPIVIAERYKFHKYHQEEGHGYRDKALRDRLVCGISSQTNRRKLFGEAVI
ncbi:hypothetical protein P5673_024512 [Acropora cervicornis]|uniref:Uncharacterized protein n=1 Tax=Acropora cervicornis TaxID=6130 RepID=A0AAD9Q3M8_ACRCE|nr:hypothetical protein P5673_024512 [Acropora cervicornis]